MAKLNKWKILDNNLIIKEIECEVMQTSMSENRIISTRRVYQGEFIIQLNPEEKEKFNKNPNDLPLDIIKRLESNSAIVIDYDSTGKELIRFIGGIKQGVGNDKHAEMTGIIKGKSLKYSGGVKEGKFNGYGESEEDGYSYKGNWRDNKKEGHGVRSSKNGMYDGEWKNNYQHGEGEYTGVDGVWYKGNWQNGQRHGYGEFRFATGEIYKGEWYEGRRHGSGKICNKNGDEFLVEYKNNNLIKREPIIVESENKSPGFFIEVELKDMSNKNKSGELKNGSEDESRENCPKIG